VLTQVQKAPRHDEMTARSRHRLSGDGGAVPGQDSMSWRSPAKRNLPPMAQLGRLGGSRFVNGCHQIAGCGLLNHMASAYNTVQFAMRDFVM
jgi:hypothetical protein